VISGSLMRQQYTIIFEVPDSLKYALASPRVFIVLLYNESYVHSGVPLTMIR